MCNTEFTPDDENLELLQYVAKKYISENYTGSLKCDDLAKGIVESRYKILTIPPVEIELSPQEIDETSDEDDDLWIFGYGSLVWKADFPFLARKTGYIEGFERRFYQNSIDHRGTMTKPGRVVTIIRSKNPQSKVWGVAYRISKDEKQKVLDHLDFREKNGYERCSVTFYPYNRNNSYSEPRNILIYIAHEHNDSYAGQINDLESIANQIYSAVGPSGTNREYVYKLAAAMRFLFPSERDDHLFELERILKEREKEEQLIYEPMITQLVAILDSALKHKCSFEKTYSKIDVILNSNRFDSTN